MKTRIVLAILFLGALPALAQTEAPARQFQETQAAAPRKIDPTKEADIRRLLELTGAKIAAEKSMKAMMELSRTSLAKSLPQNEGSQKFVELFFKKLETKLKMDDLLELVLPIYDKHLTEEDVRELIQFYETPLGQRTAKIFPQILQESQSVGAQWGQEVGRQAAQEVLDEHPELKQALAAPPGNP